MNEIIALVSTTAEARIVVSELERAGLPRSAVTLISEEPIASDHRPETGRRSWIGAFAVGGGMLGATIALLLTIWTSHRVNLVTGGMPIASPWTFGVIVFELTALGSILSAVGRMIFEAKLVRRNTAAECLDMISDGGLAVLVECQTSNQVERAEDLLARLNAKICRRESRVP